MVCHCFATIRSIMVRIDSMVLLNEVISRQGPLLTFLPIALGRLQDAMPCLYPEESGKKTVPVTQNMLFVDIWLVV